jgi:hypothetical protein
VDDARIGSPKALERDTALRSRIDDEITPRYESEELSMTFSRLEVELEGSLVTVVGEEVEASLRLGSIL